MWSYVKSVGVRHGIVYCFLMPLPSSITPSLLFLLLTPPPPKNVSCPFYAKHYLSPGETILNKQNIWPLGVYRQMWGTENLNIVNECWPKCDQGTYTGQSAPHRKYHVNWELDNVLILAKDKERDGEEWRSTWTVCAKKWIRMNCRGREYARKEMSQ